MSVQIQTQLVSDPIDTQAVLTFVNSSQAGGVVLFLGTTREFTGGRQTASLDYEAYGAMAEQKLQELAGEAAEKWPLVACAIHHRLGPVALGEASVAIAVSTPHRAEAFEAGKWLIDMLKIVVPIWKQEHWADGSTEWVHPGIDQRKN